MTDHAAAAVPDHVESDMGTLAGISDRGLVRARNEDALALGVCGGRIAAVVCDGVSTVDRPELAARTAADITLAVLLDASTSGPAEERMRDAVDAATVAVSTLRVKGDRGPPSCTLVAVLVEHPEPGEPAEITIAWVGDSRAYWLDNTDPRVLTTDHSWAVAMVSRGYLDAQQAAADRRAHAIIRWIGPEGRAEPETVTLRPERPGVVLLCSDGLWNHEADAAALARVTLGAEPLAAATALVELALADGAHDNVTVAVVPVGLSDER
jgi:serine/threonine protein phosphatase PrpC